MYTYVSFTVTNKVKDQCILSVWSHAPFLTCLPGSGKVDPDEFKQYYVDVSLLCFLFVCLFYLFIQHYLYSLSYRYFCYVMSCHVNKFAIERQVVHSRSSFKMMMMMMITPSLITHFNVVHVLKYDSRN